MAYTAPGTAVAGDVLTAAFWNQQVRDNMEAVAGPPFARNIIYNGAMQVAQRSSSVASITASAYYTADRWQTTLGSLGTWTQSVENDAPTNTGLRRSLKVLCTTASASPAAGGVLLIEQALEGYDVQRIKKGNTDALPITLSFYVKSNVTGTYIVEIRDDDNTRHICRTYTVNVSGTWERKEVTIPADTTGVFDNDANASLRAQFWLGAGSTFNSGTLATSWAASVNANRAVGQTNLAAATSNYWQVTGVQLETGSVATGFEFLPFGDELRRCQRYFERSYDIGTASGTASSYNGASHFTVVPAATGESRGNARFAVTKRGTPTVTAYAPGTGTINTGENIGIGSPTITATDANTTAFSRITHAAQTGGQQISVQWTASSEL